MSSTNVGYIGLDHAHRSSYLDSGLLESLPVKVTCACEPNENFDNVRVDGLGDIPLYRDPSELLNSEDVDLLWVTLPDTDVPELIKTAAGAGVDVFSEKPMATDAEELNSAANAAQEAGITVGVAYFSRSDPPYRRLREYIGKSVFGDVQVLDFRYFSKHTAFRDTDSPIFDPDRAGGGILNWLGCHLVDLARWLLNEEITRVNARMRQCNAELEVEDSAIVQFETESGITGTIHCGYYTRQGNERQELHLIGNQGRGAVVPTDDGQALELEAVTHSWDGVPRRNVSYDYPKADVYGGERIQQFLNQFLNACASGEAPPVGISDAVSVLEVLDAAYRSSTSQEWIQV
jgi:predicted dehydrogenase